jgi:Cytochrome c oxidase subunit Vb
MLSRIFLSQRAGSRRPLITISCMNHAKYAFFAPKRCMSGNVPSEPVVGPGAPPGEFATEYEGAAGLERLDYLARVQGINIYNDDALRVDHYGTLDNPIQVPTVVGERIVGCTGMAFA